MAADERVTVGLVRGFHGLRGAVRVEVLSDDPERFAAGSVLFVDGDDRALTVASVQASKPGILVRFEGYDTRESVEALRERYLEAALGEPLPPGTFYWHDIRGLEVRTTTGEVLGTVSDVFRAGEGEVYIVSGGMRGEILVPGVRGVVTDLDPAAGRVTVDAVALALPDKPPRRRRRHEQSNKARRAAARAEAASRTVAAPEEAAAPGGSAPADGRGKPDAAAAPPGVTPDPDQATT